ncbi:MAG: hypothetical protein WCK42_05505, partial [Myxococcaceae bacterium]
YFAVKEAVLPFSKFDNVDSILGPEMKSTGEVMGLGRSCAEAYLKAQIGTGYALPKPGQKAIVPLDSMFRSELERLGMLCQSSAAEQEENIGLIIALGKEESALRRLALSKRICHVTTFKAAKYLLSGLKLKEQFQIESLNHLIATAQETA